jgi:hypothetical protein
MIGSGLYVYSLPFAVIMELVLMIVISVKAKLHVKMSKAEMLHVNSASMQSHSVNYDCSMPVLDESVQNCS